MNNYPDVVSMVNLKGGVGKTTMCVNLAYGLAYFLNKKVLIIDLDPQANATQYLLPEKQYIDLYLKPPLKKKTINEIFHEIEQANKGITTFSGFKNTANYIERVYKSKEGYLDLIASKLELGLLAFTFGLPVFNQIQRFVKIVGNKYDVVLIDCPPTLSTMLFSALAASQYVLIPVKPDFLSTIGFPLLEKVMNDLYPNYGNRDKEMDKLKPLGLVFNMVDNRLKMARESIKEVKNTAEKMEYPVFDAMISHSTKFTWSSKNNLPIFRTEPSSKYSKEIETLVFEFDEELNGIIYE